MVVQKTPGRCREDFHTTTQHDSLRLDVHSAVDHADAQRRLTCVLHETFVDLHGQLTSRCKNQHTHRVARGRHRGIGLGKNTLQSRKTVPGRLAGTGLSRPHHILSGENNGNGLDLNRGGRDITHFGNRCLDM